MPGMYAEGEYDIAGFTVGIVDKKKIIDGSSIRPGDVVLGLASSGVHSNGFSLVRKLLLEDKGYKLHDHVDALGEKLGNVLLTPTKLYVKPILAILDKVAIKGMAHITGGGFIENIPRALPGGVNVEIEYGSWPILPIFELMQREGGISNHDMFRTFNMGIGMVLVVSTEDAAKAIQLAEAQGEKVYTLGKVTEGNRVVTFHGAVV
jgi:phosphoribosylformylglycinamidine cyclo-ligase